MTSDRSPRGATALLLLLAVPMITAAKPAKIPGDAPYCALPGARAVFVSPSGEPYRAVQGQAYPSAGWAAAADLDHDGKVSRSELAKDALRFFATLDSDHDGRLTPEEVAAYEHDVAPEIALYSARREPGEVEKNGLFQRAENQSESYYGPMGAGRYSWLNVPQPVASADADVDRIVTAPEFSAAASRRFDALAGGKMDGLRLADLPKTPAQQAIEGPCRPRPKPRKDDDRREQSEGRSRR